MFKLVLKILSFLSNLNFLIPDKLLYYLPKRFIEFFMSRSEKRYKIFKKNLRIVYPKFDRLMIESFAKSALVSYIRNNFYSYKYIFSKPSRLGFKINEKGLKENLSKYKKNPIIIIVPHFDLHLITAKALASKTKKKIIIPLRGLMTNLSKEKRDAIYEEISSENLNFIELGGALEEIENVLKKKGIAVLAVDVDLNPKYFEEVTFFGKEFKASSGPVWLAKKFHAHILTGFALQEDSKSIRVVIEDTFENSKPTSQKIFDKLEEYIRAHPGHWNIPENFFRR
ncbi:MAG TPA: hypothetical protein VGA67_04745 [Candidatus Dojkabacteria bacterium]|jgi:lauroyl/myristoyl acyltransferase